MLAKRNADNIVRGSAYQIGTWARKTEAETLEALKVLSSPDTKRLEPQKFEGRRIEKVEGGWLILNGEHYQEVMRSMNRKNYKAIKEREYRRRRKDKAEETQAKCDGAKQAIKEGLENENMEGGQNG